MFVIRILIIGMLVSFSAHATHGWSMNMFSVKGGSNWSEVNKFTPTLGFEYGRGIKVCIGHKPFRAIGMNVELVPEVIVVQLQLKLNPFRHYGVVGLSQGVTCFSYFVLGTHYRMEKGEKAGVLFKPGIGWLTRIRKRPMLILPEVNVGYVLNDQLVNKKPYLFVELRFGLSYKKKKKTERDENLKEATE